MKASEDPEEAVRRATLEAEEEPYSPTDFINPATKQDVCERSGTSPPSVSASDKDTRPSSSGTGTPPVPMVFSNHNGVMNKQEPVRPIPIMPLDTPTFSLSQSADSIQGGIPVIPVSLFSPQHSVGENLQNPSVGLSPGCVTLYSSELKNGLLMEAGHLYDCRWQQCDKKFSAMDDLVNHVNDYHVKVERPDVDYQCRWDGCPRRGKGFNARYKMLIHIRTHTNEKPHKCNLCGKSFSRLENLKIHHRSHTGEKPYICPFEGCNKAYSNSSDRFKHVRTHQEDKPYICKMPGCNKRYTDPSSLRKHVRTHGHYFRESGQSEKSKSPTPPASSPTNTVVLPMSPSNSASSPLKTPLSVLSPPPAILSLSSLNGGGIMNIGMGGIMHLPRLASNPLLSSTILTQPVSTQTISTQTEGLVSVSIQPPITQGPLGGDRKCQESPLDLTTNPISPPEEELHIIHTQIVNPAPLISSPEGSGEEGINPHWEVIHSCT